MRRVLAFAANAIGDTYNLLAPDSKAGYVAELRRLADLAAVARHGDLGPSPAHLEATGSTKRGAGIVIPTVGAHSAGSSFCFDRELGHVGKTGYRAC